MGIHRLGDWKMTIQRTCAQVVVVLLATAANTPAQVLYGSLVGTVVDQSGASVPTARVSVTSKETAQTREAQTDESGRYNIGNLLPGSYDVKVTANGFRTLVRSDLSINPNNVSRIDATLELGATSEQVTVQAEAALLQTASSETHTALTSKPIVTLPLNQYRNYQALINLVPGATPAAFQNSSTDTPQRSLRTFVNGTNPNNNVTRLDGAANVNIWLPHHAMYVAPAETISEVNIATSARDAEQGAAGGAAITVITKSGTNDLHGSAFEFHNNQHMKSRPFFWPANQDKSRDTLNLFGGTLGGPIIRNHLFFFGSYEGTRQRTGGSSILNVPTADIRRGDFSAYLNAATGAGTIYDPTTGDENGRGRQPFPNNIIPDNRISPIARRIIALTPLPNIAGRPTENFAAAGTGKFDRDNYDGKINWNRGTKHSIWGKVSLLDATVGGIPAFGEIGGPGVGGDPGVGSTSVYLYTVGHTYTITPNLLIDQTVGYTRQKQDVLPYDFGTNYGSEVFGIPGTNGTDERYSGLPAFTFTTWSDLGRSQGWMPVFRDDGSWTHSSNISWIRGAHEVRFGFDMVRHALNHWQPEVGNPRGAFTFGGGVTALSGGPAPNEYNSYAAFLLGLPSSAGKSIQYIEMTGREWQLGWYVRDRWRVTRNFTLNLGLRLERFPLMSRKDSGIERLDLQTMQVYLGGYGNVPKDAGIKTNENNFAPSGGFAWSIGPSTVIRAGYGLSWDPLPFSRPLRGFYPLTIAGSFVGANSFTAYRPLEQGIPEVTGPDTSTGVVPLPASVTHRSPWGEIKRGNIQSWNFTVEQRMPWDLVGTVAYVGTKTSNQFAERDINSPAPGAGNTGRPYYAQFGRAIDIDMWDGWMNGNYHSLQSTIRKPFGNGILLQGAYTYSKAINYTDEDGWATVLWNWEPVLDRNRARAGYDRTHVFQIAGVYELPFGRGKNWLNSGVASWIAGNWQINGNFYAYTGTPFTVTASGASLNSSGNQQTADQVGPVKKIGEYGPGQLYYDPTSFRSVTDVRFGSTGRNILDGPGVIGVDASVFKVFPISERLRFELRGEAFNLTNTPRFNNPNADVSNANNFMQVTAASGERQLRVGARIEF